MKENADKARSLDAAELDKELRDSAEQMFRLRFQLSMGQAEGVNKLRILRKERARMLTIIRERELSPDTVPTPKAAAAAKTTRKQTAPKPKAIAKAKAAPKTKAAPQGKAAPKHQVKGRVESRAKKG